MEPQRGNYFTSVGDDAIELRNVKIKGLFKPSPLASIYYTLLAESSLFKLSWVRAHEFAKWWANEPPLFRAVRKSSNKSRSPLPAPPIALQLSELQRAFKGHLTILYKTPSLSAAGLSKQTELDLLVEQESRKLGISLVNLKDVFLEAQRNRLMPNGFSNTQPFVGHWNAVGHRLAASAVAPVLFEIHDKYGLF